MNLEETRIFWGEVRRNIGELLFIFIIINLLYMASTYNRDDSNQQGWFSKRSGMAVRTDTLTGCQYLVDDGITPRLDKNGKHIGCR